MKEAEKEWNIKEKLKKKGGKKRIKTKNGEAKDEQKSRENESKEVSHTLFKIKKKAAVFCSGIPLCDDFRQKKSWQMELRFIIFLFIKNRLVYIRSTHLYAQSRKRKKRETKQKETQTIERKIVRKNGCDDTATFSLFQ